MKNCTQLCSVTHSLQCRSGWKHHHRCSGKKKQRAEAEDQGSLPASHWEGNWNYEKSTHKVDARLHALTHAHDIFIDSGVSFEERFERRSGGCGAGSAENTGPVWCPAAETGYEGTQKMTFTHWCWWYNRAHLSQILWPHLHPLFSVLNDIHPLPCIVF